MINKQYKNSVTIAAKILLFLVFVTSASYIVLTAAGYKIVASDKSIIQTSMIAIKVLPRDVSVEVDGELQDSTLNTWRISGLQPGNHEIEIKKSGYGEWLQSVNLDPGESAIYEHVVLFLKEPVISELGEETDSGLISRLKQSKKEDRIVVKNNELNLDGLLVTRISTDISNPQIYPDDNHISYISDNKLHIVDIDGTNDKSIISLPNDSQYIFLDGGSRILFQDNDKVKIATIR